ncbi:MAG: AraC family transcriptional regulator [Opitutaceae bacterium]|nr:AraC family transcriptional regulator [Verrucomicrobiales bacterium]
MIPLAPKTCRPATALKVGRASLALLRLRKVFFQRNCAATELLQPFNHIPGVLYFVKDAQSRLMAISAEAVQRLGFKSEEELIGRKSHEYLPKDIADKFLADDRWIIQHGKPLLNMVEMWITEQGGRDWIVTNKFPLRSAKGKVVGLIGIIQSFEARRKLLAHLGPVGRAADYIRDHLGDSMMLSQIAAHAGFSERQLQRLFHRVFGMTIQKFIIQSRVHAAIHELTHSDRSIAEIATLCGFNDQSALTNKFRLMTGLPPRIYRQRYIAKFTT